MRIQVQGVRCMVSGEKFLVQALGALGFRVRAFRAWNLGCRVHYGAQGLELGAWGSEFTVEMLWFRILGQLLG